MLLSAALSSISPTNQAPSVAVAIQLCLITALLHIHRLLSDVLMLASFGDAKERNKQQFNTLLEATGWKLNKITPTNGIFLVLEAVPVYG